MNELFIVNADGEEPRVSARQLYKDLEVSKRFSSWFETNSQGFIDGEDFTSVLSGTVVNKGAYRELQDYQLSTDMAKHICLMSRTDRGKECRQKLPKFRNGVQVDENGKNIRGTGKMIFNWFEWQKDGKDIPKIHPAQKTIGTLKQLIEIFTDEGDVVIDPCAGSGSTLRAARELGRSAFGFEIDRNFYKRATEEMLAMPEEKQMSIYDFV